MIFKYYSETRILNSIIAQSQKGSLPTLPASFHLTMFLNCLLCCSVNFQVTGLFPWNGKYALKKETSRKILIPQLYFLLINQSIDLNNYQLTVQSSKIRLLLFYSPFLLYPQETTQKCSNKEIIVNVKFIFHSSFY